VYYDPDTELINMIATINDGSYAAWGWGHSMTSTEMVIFQANGSSSFFSFVYGIGGVDPVADPDLSGCYTTSFEQNSDGTVTLKATRPLECGIVDYGGGSYVVQLDTNLRLIICWFPTNYQLVYHEGYAFKFSQMFSSDGACEI